MAVEEKAEEVELGDVFIGRLRKKLKPVNTTDSDRIFYIDKYPKIIVPGTEFAVKTLMGWRDLPCLNFQELNDRNYYLFEVISQDKNKRVTCRALEQASDELFFRKIPESNFREKPSYNKREEAIVILSRTQKNQEFTDYLGFFFDPYYPEMTGQVFGLNNYERFLVGKRILAGVTGRKNTYNGRFVLYAGFLKEVEE